MMHVQMVHVQMVHVQMVLDSCQGQWFGKECSYFLPFNARKDGLKGTATLMIIMFDMKEPYEPLILIPVSSKSVEKYRSYGRLNIC